MTEKEIADLGNVPAILDGTYFRIISEKNGDIKAKCMMCSKTYNGTLRATSNFLKHLKQQHPTLVAKYEQHKISMSKVVRTKLRKTDGDCGSLATIAAVTTSGSNMFHKSWQKKADILVTNMLIAAALPIHIVEVPEFKELVSQLSKMPEPVHCLSTKTVSKCIEDRCQLMKSTILEKMSTAQFFCTTADIWSSRRKSFLGVTVHWLNKSFERESFAIACTRFKGIHNFTAIAKQIDHAHQRYGLNAQNVVYTVTDNASNMVKAFKEFGVDVNSESSIESDDDDIVVVENVDADDERGDSDDDVVEIENTADLLDNGQNENEQYFLPQHIRCATHTLNLIATSDIQKAMESKGLTANGFDRTYRQSMSRCSQLWNLLNRSANKASEAFIAKFGHFVRLPCATRCLLSQHNNVFNMCLLSHL